MKPLYTFLTLANKQNLFALNSKIYNSEILLPENTPQSAFFDFPYNKKNFLNINHLSLTFKCYLLKSRDTRKISLKELRKNIIKIYNIEKQICFNDSKKQSFKNIAYVRKPIKMN